MNGTRENLYPKDGKWVINREKSEWSVPKFTNRLLLTQIAFSLLSWIRHIRQKFLSKFVYSNYCIRLIRIDEVHLIDSNDLASNIRIILKLLRTHKKELLIRKDLSFYRNNRLIFQVLSIFKNNFRVPFMHDRSHLIFNLLLSYFIVKLCFAKTTWKNPYFQRTLQIN